MAVYAITFSPVGGTRKAAGFFLKGFCSDGISIDLTDRALAFSDMAFTARDICLVAVPAYGGRVPRPAAERLGQMHGGGARAILMAVYGTAPSRTPWPSWPAFFVPRAFAAQPVWPPWRSTRFSPSSPQSGPMRRTPPSLPPLPGRCARHWTAAQCHGPFCRATGPTARWASWT